MRAHTAVVIALTFSTLVFSSADAQPPERVALSLHGVLGFGGSAVIESAPLLIFGPSPGRHSLRPTLGADVRLEGILSRYFGVGASVSLLSVAVDGGGLRVNDFNPFAIARAPVVMSEDGRTLAPYLLVQGGFTTAAGIGSDDRRSWRGWNLGAAIGVSVEIRRGIALSIEMGWRYHDVGIDEEGFEIHWEFHQSFCTAGLRIAI